MGGRGDFAFRDHHQFMKPRALASRHLCCPPDWVSSTAEAMTRRPIRSAEGASIFAPPPGRGPLDTGRRTTLEVLAYLDGPGAGSFGPRGECPSAVDDGVGVISRIGTGNRKLTQPRMGDQAPLLGLWGRTQPDLGPSNIVKIQRCASARGQKVKTQGFPDTWAPSAHFHFRRGGFDAGHAAAAFPRRSGVPSDRDSR